MRGWPPAARRRPVDLSVKPTLTGERALLRPFVDDDLADRLDLAVVDEDRAGRTMLQATARFHHPAHAAEWAAPAVDDDLTAVIDVLLRGLGAR